MDREPWIVIGALITLQGCVAGAPVEAPVEGDTLYTSSREPCGGGPEGLAGYEDQTALRGLDVTLEASAEGLPGASVVAVDLDADGDVDLAIGHPSAGPHLLENDGLGMFERVDGSPRPLPPLETGDEEHGGDDDDDAEDSQALAHAAVDLTGDGLPELLVLRDVGVQVSENLGGMRFGPARIWWSWTSDTGVPEVLPSTFSFGDIDSDGDPDILLVGQVTFGGDSDCAGQCVSGPDLLLRNDGFDEPLVVQALLGAEQPALSWVGAMTDRDSDGDPDIFVASHTGFDPQPNNAFYRNDGVTEDGPILIDDAEQIGVAPRFSGMGIATADLNQDGALDYCLTDTGPVVCFESDPSGVYVETGLSRGLRPASASIDDWVGWSIEVVDLDNDGLVDAAASSGDTGFAPTGGAQPDAVWAGQADGRFVDVAGELDLDEDVDRYGLAAADLDADGTLELVSVARSGAVRVLGSPCTCGAWLDVDFVGPPGNADALGAQVEIEVNGTLRRREIQGLRTAGQGPSVAHFGLGAASRVDALRVLWPGGRATELGAVDVPSRVVVAHPEASPAAVDRGTAWLSR